MNTWKVILATLVIFGTGVMTGGLLVSFSDRIQSRMLVQSETRAPGNPPAARPLVLPQLLRKDFLQNLDRELRLSPEQRERIERILTEGQERNRQLWEPIAPQIRRELQDVRERIRGTLTPEQRRRFEEVMRQRPSRKATEDPSPPDRRPRDQYRSPPPPDSPAVRNP